MRLKYFFLILIFALGSLVHPSYSQNTQTQHKTHTVKKGETIYSIAKSYGVTPDEMYKANPEIAKGVRVDQVVIIPGSEIELAESPYTFHSIQPKETLFSVSKLYNVTVDDIAENNPGVSAENFKIGTVIRIPINSPRRLTDAAALSSRQEFRAHKVQGKETLFGLSKQYGVSMQEIADANPIIKTEGLNKGMDLRIPIASSIDRNSVPQAPATASGNVNPVDNPLLIGKNDNVIRVGLLLPFSDNKEQMQARLLEYYEGFLLAVEDVKTKGYSADIFVFDISKNQGVNKLKNLLETTEMKNLDLIIGGVTDEEVSILSRFAVNNGLNYVAPFPVKNGAAVVSDRTYQANISQSDLYPKVVDKFFDLFKDYNVIILEGTDKHDKGQFTDMLKSQFEKNYRSVKIVSSDKADKELQDALALSKKNIIVPSSGSMGALSKLIPVLRTIEATSPDLQFSLFGYPDWQTYTSRLLPDFYKYNTYIYSSFYADDTDSKTQQFYDRYKKWYGKTMINSYPKYGLMGYDTGLYFLTAIAKNIYSFEKRADLINIPTLQSSFFFEDAPKQKGFVNTGLYFIHYTPAMTIEKMNYSK